MYVFENQFKQGFPKKTALTLSGIMKLMIAQTERSLHDQCKTLALIKKSIKWGKD
jgi:hypothetical protein